MLYAIKATVSRRRLAVVIVLAALMVASLGPPASSAARPAGQNADPKPTIVLIHSVWADSSSWSGVIERLHKEGYQVIAPANPLRDVAGDSAYLASILQTIAGPIVLAGHSYGGEVITNAATGNPNVKALVYIAAFAPDQGETSLELGMKYPGSELPGALVTRPYPLPGGGTDEDVYLDPAKFRDVLAADLPESETKILAATQRPGSIALTTTPSGPPAWKTIPSWTLVPTADKVIPPAAQLWMAQRAHARVVQVHGSSHAVMISRPQATARVIQDAAEATD